MSYDYFAKLLIAILAGLAPAALVVAASHAAELDTLSAEASVRVDDMVIRRVRDPSNGVVCYTTSSYAFAVAPHGRTVAIACLKEKP